MFCTNHIQGIRLQVHELPFFNQINTKDQMLAQCPLRFRENTILIYFLLLRVEEISMEYVQQAFFY